MAERSTIGKTYDKINTTILVTEGAAVVATAVFPPLMFLHAPAAIALTGDLAGSEIINNTVRKKGQTGKTWNFWTTTNQEATQNNQKAA